MDDDDGYDNSVYRDLDEDNNGDNSPPFDSRRIILSQGSMVSNASTVCFN